MELKELGKTGVMLPEIGLGTSEYTGGLGPLRRGVAEGAFLIDTAEAYGTEEVVGDAAKGRRESVFIATKVSSDHLRYDQVLAAANDSLSKLRTDYIDLYQVHSPSPDVPIAETMRAMATLVGVGKVRYVGVCNFNVQLLEEARANFAGDIVSDQVPYNLADREIEDSLLPYCEENGITVLAYSPLSRGRLTSWSVFWRSEGINVLRAIAAEAGKTPVQAALNWCTSRSNVIAVTKSSREERIVEACGASGWRLSAEHIEALSEAFGHR